MEQELLECMRCGKLLTESPTPRKCECGSSVAWLKREGPRAFRFIYWESIITEIPATKRKDS